jgi:hypothetical protein
MQGCQACACLLVCGLLLLAGGGSLCAQPTHGTRPVVPMPLDTSLGRFLYQREIYNPDHHRVAYFLEAARFIGRHPQLSDILSFDTVHTDATVILARGRLQPLIYEVRVRIEYNIRIAFTPDGYNYQVYDFYLDRRRLEDLYYYPRDQLTLEYLRVLDRSYALIDNHVRGVTATLNRILLGIGREE